MSSGCHKIGILKICEEVHMVKIGSMLCSEMSVPLADCLDYLGDMLENWKFRNLSIYDGAVRMLILATLAEFHR